MKKNSDTVVHVFIYAASGGNYDNIASNWMLSLNEGDTIRLYVVKGPVFSNPNYRRTLNVQLIQVT